MHFTRQGQTLETVLGRDGYVFSGKLEEGGLEPHYTQQGALGFPTRGDCMLSTVSVTGLELTALADVGAGDTPYDIRGRGKANGQFIQGDVGYNVDLSFELSGSPDVKKPAFVPVTNHHPLDAISLAATEPVTSATTVALGSATGSIPLSVSNPSGSLSLFTSPLVLPFGASFAVEATGNDLIGLPFASNLPPVTTLADPGLFAQDGFEAPPKALLSGDAQVVSAVGSVSAISGARSLFVPQLASATLHLARASGTSKLSFSARSFSPVSGFAQLAPPVQVAVVGGSTRVAPSSGAGTGTIATGDPKWAYAGEPQQVSLPLSESGSDVVVRIQPAFCAGFCPIGQAVLIDDLRVE
jgi:hypothetical protein